MVKREQRLQMDGEIETEPQASLNDCRSPGPWITAWELEDLAEVIEESCCNFWKPRSKGTVPENPRWENAPSFKYRAVRNCQATAVSSMYPEVVSLEGWAAPGSCPGSSYLSCPQKSSSDCKSKWQDSPLWGKSWEHRPQPSPVSLYVLLASLIWVIILSLITLIEQF